MKRISIVSLCLLLVLGTTSCSTSCSTKSNSIDNSFTESSIDATPYPYIPSPDDYLTDTEFESYAYRYNLQLNLYYNDNMYTAIIDDFDKNGNAFAKSNYYDSMQTVYELAQQYTGKSDSYKHTQELLSAPIISPIYKLDDNNDILLDCDNVSNTDIKKIYLTFVPYDTNGSEVKYFDGNSYALTLTIDDDIPSSDSVRKKLKTDWTKENISSIKLLTSVIYFVDGSVLCYDF